jgi:hypothetical protein
MEGGVAISEMAGGKRGIRTLVPIYIEKRFSRPSRSTTPASFHSHKGYLCPIYKII